MARNERELDRDYILSLFKKLDDKMFAVDLEETIYIVGGAALITTVNAMRTTTDIDAATTSNPRPELLPLIKEISEEEEGLGPDWLNYATSTVLSYFKKDLGAKTIFIGKRLCIQAAGPDYVLAMKLAARRDKDIEDIKFLVGELGITNREGLVDIAKCYFMADLSPEGWQRLQIEEFIDIILEEGELEFAEVGPDTKKSA